MAWTPSAVGELVGRPEGLGYEGAAGGDEESVVGGSVGRLAQPEAARDDVATELLLAEPGGGAGEGCLVDRRGGEPQVERAAVRLLHAGQAVEQEPLELAGVGRLAVREPRRLEPDAGRIERLVRSALAPERDPGRCPAEHEARPRVDGVDDALERAHHERVVERPDRKQTLALEVPRQPELPEREHEVHLGDSHLDVLSGACDAPAQGRVLHGVVDVLVFGAPDACLVDEAAEVGGHRHVRGDRHETFAHAVDAREIEQDAPERCLGRDLGRVAFGERRRHRDRRRQRAFSAVEPGYCGGEQPSFGAVGRKSVPFGLGCETDLGAEAVDLLAVQERRMILRSPGDLELVSLDRVGEDHGGPIGRLAGPAQCVQHVREVVPTEIADEREQPSRVAVEHSREPRALLSSKRLEQRGSDDVFGRAEQRLVLLVGHLVDPAVQELTPALGVTPRVDAART